MELKNIAERHAGKMAFLLGAAPSLHFQDLSPLKDYITFTVNSSIMKMPNSDYFVSDDQGIRFWNYYKEDLLPSSCIKLLYREKFDKSDLPFNRDRVVFFDHKWWFSPPDKYNLPDGLILTKDPNAPIIGARTSVGTALHLAYIMGCDPIVLLGCDCCYVERKRYFWQFPGEKEAIRFDNQITHLNPNRGQRNGKMIDSHCRHFEEYWTKLAEINAGKINIVYASEGGILDCFPKMTLIETINQYGDRKK